MIVQSQEAKAQTSLIDLLGGTSKGKSGKANDVFAQLLSSLGGNSTAKQVDFTALIDPKQASVKSSKVSALQTLLTGEDEKDAKKMLPKELINVLSNDQIHSLIHRAKEYLKNEITAKSPDKQLDPKTLPKTLMGLLQLADKMGLNPQAITLSSLNESQNKPLPLPDTLQNQLLFNPKALQETLKTPAATTDPAFEAITQLISDAKAKEMKSEKTAKKESASEQPLKSLLQAVDKGSDTMPAVESPKPQKETKKTSSNSDLLIGLLQGGIKAKETESSDTESKKVEAESSKSQTHSAVPKADTLEVKAKEAAQSMRFFASDLKEAVESYKPPFTRLTMTLNPEKLGEVEVTLIQRGNNVHVNIQSNNANSVAFLAHNAMELKSQLAHQGITNTTMNFMSGGEGQAQNQSQQQQQQNRFRAYESLQDLELNKEQLSALEIIIPHYA